MKTSVHDITHLEKLAYLSMLGESNILAKIPSAVCDW